MKRTALVVGGLVGVVLLVAGVAGLPGAGAAPLGRRAVGVKTPAPAKVAVVVVRFRLGPGAPPPRLRLAGPYTAAPASAAVAGVARVRGRRGLYVGVVAIASFRSNAVVSSSSRPILAVSGPRPLVLDYSGDAERYRGRLTGALRGVSGGHWTVSVARSSTAVDPRYGNGRALLVQVARLLTGRPDPGFLTALRGASGPPQHPGLPVLPPPPSPSPPPPPPPALPQLIRLSSDPFTNASSQHRAQVEPDSFAFGSTLVTAFQSGRFTDGGSSGIGFATSSDGGTTWVNGFLPKLTVQTGDGGTYERATDPSVAYDAKHDVWMIETLAMIGPHGTAVVVSRSTNGGRSWSAPVTVASHSDLDKNWIACDNHPASPHYGNCYSEWDDAGNRDLIELATSSDGGLTWGAAKNTADRATGLGGQPVVQPDGTVVVPIGSPDLGALLSFSSGDGGASWSATTRIAPIFANEVAGDLRAEPIPSAEIDAAGRVYVVWQDCRFRPFCGVGGAAGNDLVLSASDDGQAWTAPTRVPIDPTGAGDYFIPGLGVDPATAGASARLALAYFYYPRAACAVSTCELDAGFISSSDGGATWGATSQLAGPMALDWLPTTTGGLMVGDYISTSFASGVAHPFFAVAHPRSGGQLDQAIYTR